jgi:hypothetical protein
MRAMLCCSLVAVGVVVAQGFMAQAETPDSPCPPPCGTPCAPPTVVGVAAPKVIVEVPPPQVVLRQSGSPACVEQEGLIKRCCHFGQRATCVQPIYPVASAPMAPLTIQPVSVAPMTYQPIAAPVAAPLTYQPLAAPVAAPMTYSPVAAPMTYQPLAAPMAAPTSFQPMAAPQAIIVPLAVNPAAPTPPAAPAAPTATDSGTDCNKALQRVTAQMETLTKVVEKHTLILTSHERRIQRMEDYLKDNPTKNDKTLPLPSASDKD